MLGTLTPQDGEFCLYTKWFGYATQWTFGTLIGLLQKAFSNIRTKFWIYIAGFVFQCGLISLNMGITAAWFDWTLAIYPTPLIIRNWKQCYVKYVYIAQRAIPIVDFVGDELRIILTLKDHGGTYPPGWTILSLNTQSDLVMPLTGHLWPKLDCCTTSCPIWGPILYITGFLVKCGLIWLNMDTNAAWFDWTLAIYTSLLTFRDWK